MRNRIGVSAGAVAAALALAALSGGCSKTTQESVTVTPAAFVAESAHATLAQRTADVVLDGSVSAAGMSVPLKGTGQVDFGTNAMSMDATETVHGHAIHLQVVQTSGKGFMNISADGHSLSDLTGKPWIELPVSSSPMSLIGSDPAAQLRILEQQGATITPLGHKTIEGISTTGYSIVPSKETVQKSIQDEISQMGLTPQQVSQIQDALQQVQAPTFTVWFDSSHLMRQMSVLLSLGGAVAASGSVEMNFVHYGTPVHITAPPASDAVSFQQFLQDVQEAGSSSS
ncbi:MAG TPA: hypothetical protein VFJ79_07335 [Acidimicrobiales bacterium]|nr:hypothetical protein [Acidimicrobiales bacterium]